MTEFRDVRERPVGYVGRMTAGLGGHVAPIAVGIITALLVAYVWGGLDVPGVYHDERAYVVQARLLAHFSWTAPSPPVPILWEMAHVYVEPAVFAKYPPGHAPLLVPGVWLGLPGLVPVLFAGLAAALFYVLARELAGVWVALGAWAVWTVVPETLDWHSSYFSESTTVACWLGALVALHRWWRTGSAASLLLIVLCVGWLGLARPITGMALGLPIAVVVVVGVIRRRALRGWPVAAVAGVLIVAMVPYWSVRTLGSATPLPYAEYSRWYFPWDLPGFVRDTSPPLRTLPPDFEALARATQRNYEGHTWDAVPRNAVTRAHRVVVGAIGPVLAPLWVLVPLGIATLGAGIGAFAAGSFVLLVGAYLVMPHASHWTIYYLEMMPLVSFGALLGMRRLLAWATRAAIHAQWAPVSPQRLHVAFAIALAVVVGITASGIPGRRWLEAVRGVRQRHAQAMIQGLEDPNAVIFVRRSDRMNPHFTLWDILGPPERTPTWIVRDMGPDLNGALMRRAEGRRPYRLDEDTMTLTAWTEGAPAPPLPE